MSSLGKGIASATVGTLLQSRGFSIRMKKLDPYINIDPGTMSPYKHGEVFVTDDGGETDLDFGHYERFTGIKCSVKDSLTTGKVYKKVLEKERNGEYLGSDIQVIPHITNEIKDFVLRGSDDVDFTICEIGGTVGDIESLPYIEAIRQMISELGKQKVLCLHLTYLPYIKVASELKTKPTQHSVKELQSLGVQPDIILCRSEKSMTESIKSKISMFCNIKKENIIDALDADNIYFIPKQYHDSFLDRQILEHFGILNVFEEKAKAFMEERWLKLERFIRNCEQTTKLAVVGKYTGLKDAYISLSQAIMHAGFVNNTKVDVDWIDAEEPVDQIEERLAQAKAIIVPGGFSSRGAEGKLAAIKYARENKIPFLGICLGMQLAVIEACRNVAKVNATSSEFGEEGECVIDFMESWDLKGSVESRTSEGKKGGTMRLGSYPCVIAKDSLAFRVYGKENISERHRHRYEVNLKKYGSLFQKAGLFFSGMTPDGMIPEILERRDHPFFIATQAHPEFKSNPFSSHPLFQSLVRSALDQS